MFGAHFKRNPIIRQILVELERQSRELCELEEFLDLAGIHLPIMMVDEWAGEPDLRLIAIFLNIPPSELIALTGDRQATAKACFNELWEDYEKKLRISMARAWSAVESSTQFRGGHPAKIRNQVELILCGLLPPDRPSHCPNFLDCMYGCITKCVITGRKPGA